MRELKEEEIWKPVVEYEGFYEVSNLGRLFRFAYYSPSGRFYEEKLMRTYNNHKGYLQVYLSKNGKKFSTLIHRLMAKAFIPNPDNKPEINHKNGIKTDNRLENLE